MNDAQQREMIPPGAQVAVDCTGLENSSRSGYYHQVLAGRRRRFRRWPKLALACLTQNHLITAALLVKAPTQDAPLLEPLMVNTCWRVEVKQSLADAGFDSEANHQLMREGLGIRSSVIRLNRRGTRRWPTTRYRRQMARRFLHRVYGQRWQIESVISRLKRRLGPALRCRSDAARRREMHLKILTHDLMLLAAWP